MKKVLILMAVMLLGFALSACSSQNNGMSPRNKPTKTQNLSTGSTPGDRQNVQTENDEANGRFGYVHHQQAPRSNKEAKGGGIHAVDREALADRIGRLAVRLPGVTDAETLVTNSQVLVGYKSKAKNRKQQADQVKNTAASVVPRYYHVYVTDNPHLFPDIQRFQNLSTTDHVQNMLDDTIREMKKSPQGKKLNPGENKNGENKHDRRAPEKKP